MAEASASVFSEEGEEEELREDDALVEPDPVDRVDSEVATEAKTMTLASLGDTAAALLKQGEEGGVQAG